MGGRKTYDEMRLGFIEAEMKLWALAVSYCLLTACAGTRTADLDIGERSYVIVDVLPQSVGVGRPMVILARFAPERRIATDWEYDSPTIAPDGTQWNVIAVSPGDYVIMSLGLGQGSSVWSACFGASTYQLSVKDNDAVYIGSIDPKPTIRTLNEQVRREGIGLAHGGEFKFAHENFAAPAISLKAPTPSQLEMANAAFQARHPKETRLVRWATLKPANFLTSQSKARIVSCGG